jgi:acetyltransferase-like isoleucine patch superfamily enzyme
VLYSHSHGLEKDLPIREQPLSSNGPIVIEEEAWLGTRVTVLSGVRIGKGAAVGAGALVTQDIPDYAIAVGNPARVVRYRGA